MSHNTWIHRVARVGVRPLVKTAVTPNQITTLRLAVGIAAAIALAVGSDVWRHWGAGIFLLSMLLDRADGELARLSGKTSPGGHKYDLISDSVCNALAFLGLGIGLTASPFGSWAPLMGAVAGLAIAAILWLVIKLEQRGGERAGELAGAAGFDPDDAMLVVPICIWFGLSEWLLASAAVGAPLFAVFMVLWFRFGPRQAGSPQASSDPASGTSDLSRRQAQS